MWVTGWGIFVGGFSAEAFNIKAIGSSQGEGLAGMPMVRVRG